MYAGKIHGARIRNKCCWYKHFFLNLEKSWVEQNKSSNVLKVQKEFTSQTQINKKTFKFL